MLATNGPQLCPVAVCGLRHCPKVQCFCGGHCFKLLFHRLLCISAVCALHIAPHLNEPPPDSRAGLYTRTAWPALSAAKGYSGVRGSPHWLITGGAAYSISGCPTVCPKLCHLNLVIKCCFVECQKNSFLFYYISFFQIGNKFAFQQPVKQVVNEGMTWISKRIFYKVNLIILRVIEK